MKLGEIVSLVRGKTYKSSLLSEINGPVLLGLGSIAREGGFKHGAWKHYPGVTDQKILLQPGDLYVSLKDLTQACSLLGAVARVPEYVRQGRLTQDTVKLVFHNDADAATRHYVYWSLRTPQYRAYCRARGTGTTNMSLSRSDFLSWELPPKTVHNDYLIELFELLESKIYLNQRTNDYLLQLCTARYDEARREIAANEDASEQAVLTDLIEVCYGKDHKKLADGKYPVYGSGGLMRHVENYLHEGESVLIPRKGTLNNVMIVHGRFWTVDTMFYTKELFTGAARYAYFILSKLDLASMNAGSAVPSMTTKILSAIPVLLPSAAKLAELKSWSDPLFEQIRLNEKENERLEALRDALLPKLMSGEIDVSQIELPTQPNNHLADC